MLLKSPQKWIGFALPGWNMQLAQAVYITIDVTDTTDIL